MHSQGLVAILCLHPVAWRQLQKRFPFPDQVFRQPGSQKIGNTDQFKPNGLFELKHELSDTATSLLYALLLCVKIGDPINAWVQRRCSASACRHHHPHSIAQMFNHFMVEKVFYFQTCLFPVCTFLAHEITLIYRTFINWIVA